MRVIEETGKDPLDLIPLSVMRSVARVLAGGNLKPGRGEFNWLTAYVRKSNMTAGALRHIADDAEGIERDPESGEPHLAHAIARLIIALHARMHGTLIERKPPHKRGRK